MLFSQIIFHALFRALTRQSFYIPVLMSFETNYNEAPRPKGRGIKPKRLNHYHLVTNLPISKSLHTISYRQTEYLLKKILILKKVEDVS
jgi:hypothetical protein